MRTEIKRTQQFDVISQITGKIFSTQAKPRSLKWHKPIEILSRAKNVKDLALKTLRKRRPEIFIYHNLLKTVALKYMKPILQQIPHIENQLWELIYCPTLALRVLIRLFQSINMIPHTNVGDSLI